MTWTKWLVCVGAVFALSGCIARPYEWSPDGKWMTVISGDGLRIADGNGKLQPPVVRSVQNAAWFGDSKRLVVDRAEPIEHWNGVTPYLTPKDISAVNDVANRIRAFAMTYDWTSPDADSWDKFKAALADQEAKADRPMGQYSDIFPFVAMYLRDNADEAFRKRVPDARWRELAIYTADLFTVQIYTFTGSSFTPGGVLNRGLLPAMQLRVSPGDRAVLVSLLFDINRPELVPGALKVISCDGRSSLTLSDRAAFYPDWSPDGTQVVFMEGAAGNLYGNAPRLGTLITAAVVADGKVLSNATQVVLTDLVFDFFGRARWLNDGRIIFSVTLPSPRGHGIKPPELFVVTPDKPETLTRLFPKQATDQSGGETDFFAVSPDGRRIAIPQDRGRINVFDLASGQVMTVQNKDMSDNRMKPAMPSWRNDDELTFLAPDEKGRLQVVLRSISTFQEKVLSAEWPPGTILENNYAAGPKQVSSIEPQPATAPAGP